MRKGFCNFLSSLEAQIVHFCAGRYLCGTDERYHITDLSKGAMLVKHAGNRRVERYDRWYPLLEEELALVSRPGAGVVAVGKEVCKYLAGKRLPCSRVVHYSGQAAMHWKGRIAVHEREFEDFRNSVSLEDVLPNAQALVARAGLPVELEEEIMSPLVKSRLSESHLHLMFNYKTAFESMRQPRVTERDLGDV